MFKGRNIGALGMAALQGLLQLLRVSEQNEIFRRLGSGQDIRQRHLPGLVDEKHVYRFKVFLSGPKPGCAGDNVRAFVQRRKRLIVIGRQRNAGRIEVRFLFHLLYASKTFETCLLCRRDYLVEQVADDLVARRGDAHFLS
jgi:hypothetical protein